MALVKGICKNFGECDLADSKEIQEVEKTNFVCEECGKPLYEVKPTLPSPPVKKWVVILITIFLLLCGIGAYLFWPSDKDSVPLPLYPIQVSPDSCTLSVGDSIIAKAKITAPSTTDTILTWSSSDSTVATVSNGLIRAVARGQAKITVRSNDINVLEAHISVNIAADSVKVVLPTDTDTLEPEPRPLPVPMPPETPRKTPPINLKGASFSGTLQNGYPHGHGILTFKQRRRIDIHDQKENIAEKGDYIVGKWDNGHLIYGDWYGEDNYQKSHINLGGINYPEEDHTLYH